MAEPGPTFINRKSKSCDMQAIVKNQILFLFLCLGTTSFLPAQASVPVPAAMQPAQAAA
jgi:hypothetical protein